MDEDDLQQYEELVELQDWARPQDFIADKELRIVGKKDWDNPIDQEKIQQYKSKKLAETGYIVVDNTPFPHGNIISKFSLILDFEPIYIQLLKEHIYEPNNFYQSIFLYLVFITFLALVVFFIFIYKAYKTKINCGIMKEKA